MTRDDQERLRNPYSARTPVDLRIPQAVGVRTEHCQTLAGEIFADMDEVRRGIGWWSGGLDAKRRILIADHVHLSALSLSMNLVEAAVHLMEARGAAEAIERRLVDAVRLRPGSTNLTVDFPENRCPEDDLQGVLIRMHVVGCVRALASALDCLAAVTIGVLAIPRRIFKASHREAMDSLAQLANASDLQGRAASEVLAYRARAGPDAWDSWLLDYRNMLVHRGRHSWISKLHPTGVLLHTPGNEQVLPHAMIPVLPRDPGRSEVEVLRDATADQGFLLTESAWTTLSGARESAVDFCEGTCRTLLAAWRERRASPDRLMQPRAQWPDVAVRRDPLFRGYRPGSVPFDPSEFRTTPGFPKRLRAACLDGEDRLRWNDLDDET